MAEWIAQYIFDHPISSDHSMHRGLAALDQSDERFRESIDRHGQGLTALLAEAIRAAAARHQE
jgi:hypothetical protein